MTANVCGPWWPRRSGTIVVGSGPIWATVVVVYEDIPVPEPTFLAGSAK